MSYDPENHCVIKLKKDKAALLEACKELTKEYIERQSMVTPFSLEWEKQHDNSALRKAQEAIKLAEGKE